MNCPSEAILLKFELGELTVNEAKSIDEHASTCATCKAWRAAHRQLVEDLAARPAALGPHPEPPAPASADDEAFVLRVMDACKRAPAAPPPRRVVPIWAGWVAAVAAAAALLFGVVPLTRERAETWTARGAPHAKKPVGAEVLVARGSKSLPVEGAVLGPGDGFVVRYWNAAQDPKYLAAFAVDSQGAVHWIYPAYEDPDSEPRSVPLARTESTLFGEAVEPDKPAAGPLRVVALVSGDPISVKTIERRIAEAKPGTPIAKLFPKFQIHEWACSWSHP